MMAPQYERARLLCTAINEAASELLERIDRVEVARDHVLIEAGTRRLAYRYYYANAYAPDGSAMPGSGRWVVEKTDGNEISAGRLQKLFAWLRKLT